MLDALIQTIQIILWLGIVLGLLVIVNTICGAVYNTNEKNEAFSWAKMWKGIGKAVIFYGCCALVAIAFTLLPFVNKMITDIFGIQLIAEDILKSLSTVAVLGVIVAAIVTQGKKALEELVNLTKVSANVELITWEVEDPNEEEKK